MCSFLIFYFHHCLTILNNLLCLQDLIICLPLGLYYWWIFSLRCFVGCCCCLSDLSFSPFLFSFSFAENQFFSHTIHPDQFLLPPVLPASLLHSPQIHYPSILLQKKTCFQETTKYNKARYKTLILRLKQPNRRKWVPRSGKRAEIHPLTLKSHKTPNYYHP